MGGELNGALMTLAVAGAGALLKWLFTSKARAIDALPSNLHQIELTLVKIEGRLSKAESEIANDKAGRAAFAAAREDLAAINATLGTMRQDVRDLWSAVNTLRAHPRDAA